MAKRTRLEDHQTKLTEEENKRKRLLDKLARCDRNIIKAKEKIRNEETPQTLPIEIWAFISEIVFNNHNICESPGLIQVSRIYYSLFMKRNNFKFLQDAIEYGKESLIDTNEQLLHQIRIMQCGNIRSHNIFPVYNKDRRGMDYLKYPEIPNALISTLLTNKTYIIPTVYYSYIIKEFKIILEKEMIILNDKRDSTFPIEFKDQILQRVQYCLDYKYNKDRLKDEDLTERNTHSKYIILMIYLLFIYRKQSYYSSLIIRECPFIRNPEGNPIEPVKHHTLLKDIFFYDKITKQILPLYKLKQIYYIEGIDPFKHGFEEQRDRFIESIEDKKQKNKTRLAMNGGFSSQQRSLFFDECLKNNLISKDYEDFEEKKLHIRKAVENDCYRDVIVIENDSINHILDEIESIEEFKKYIFKSSITTDNSLIRKAYEQVIYEKEYKKLTEKILNEVKNTVLIEIDD